MFENVDIHTYIHTYIQTTEAYLYYKLTNEHKGSGELKRGSKLMLAILRLLGKRVHMCNISVLSEISAHNNEISPVNAKMVKLSSVKSTFV